MFKIIHMMIVLFLHMALAFPSETRENAMGFLSRRRRANSGAEELLPGNLQQECIDEVCNYEEAREVFETDLAGLQQWWAEKHGEPEADNNTGIIVGCVIGAIVLIIIIVIIVAATKASKKSTPSDYNQYPRGERPPPYAVAQGYLHTGHGQMPQIKIRDPQLRLAVSNCYIERSSVSLGSLVKEGNFGMVYKSTWRLEDGTEKTVAAKTMKHIETETQLMNFLKEGVMMKGNV